MAGLSTVISRMVIRGLLHVVGIAIGSGPEGPEAKEDRER